MGVGDCTTGTQRCDTSGEFGHWGACEGGVLPQPEVCDGGTASGCESGWANRYREERGAGSRMCFLLPFDW